MNTVERYPLTAPQQRIWYLEQLYPNTSIGVISVMLRLRSKTDRLDPVKLEQCVHRILERNDSLRLRIVDQQGSPPYQYVHSYHPSSLPQFDMTALTPIELETWLRQRSNEPMEWNDAPLYEFTILTRPHDLLLYFRLHHIISDGITIHQFIDELITTYCLPHDSAPCLYPARPSYLTYMRNETLYNESKRKEQDKQFWLNYMQRHQLDEREQAESTVTRVLHPAADRHRAVLPSTIAKRLYEQCEHYQWSLASFFTAMLLLQQSIHTQHSLSTIGLTISNRTGREEKEMPGMCVSILPMQMNVQEHRTAASFITAVAREQFKLVRHQRYPYNELVTLLREEAGIEPPLFTTAIEYRVTDSLNLHGNPVLEYEWEHMHSGYEENDLLLRVHQVKESEAIHLELDYRTHAYTKDDIVSMAEQLLWIAEQMVTAPEQSLQDIESCPTADRQLISAFNATEQAVDLNHHVVSLFIQQASRTPTALAVIGGGIQLTYKELDERSNQLAYTLISMGVTRESIVAIMMGRTPDLLVSMLAVWKAGGACLPIDPMYPIGRIHYLMEDSGAIVLITDRSGAVSDLLHEGIACCFLTGAWWGQESERNRTQEDNRRDEQSGSIMALPDLSACQLAYLIYTSGSTGAPKGVMIEHRSFSNTLQWRRQEYDFQEQHVILPLLSSAFDGFLISYWTPLLAGCCTLLPTEDELKDLTLIQPLLNHYDVSHLVATPTLYEAMLDRRATMDLSSLHHVTLAGERISNRLLHKSKESYPKLEVIIEYGPTENSVVTTLRRHAAPTERYSIGRPVANQRLYVLDANRKLKPIGAAGQLYVAGAGLARGYHRQPALTEERFLTGEEVSRLGEERLYQTGDIAAWLPNGELEFIGRADHQMKIRGYRLELGEIEAAIAALPDVETAAVIANRQSEDQEHRLLAFVVPVDGLLDIEQCRSLLERQLPSYMLPSAWIIISQMPMTAHGKRDDQALLSLAQDWAADLAYIPAATWEEEQLVRIWEEVLHINPIGVETSFWDLGGDSIKVMHVTATLHAAGYVLKAQDMYRYPTIRMLAQRMMRAQDEHAASQLIEGEVLLTPIQLWFWTQSIRNRDWWNQAFMLRFHARCHLPALTRMLDQLVAHHDALRMAFDQQPDSVVQRYRSVGDGEMYSLDVYDLRSHANPQMEIRRLATIVQQKTRLASGPLLAAALFQLHEEDKLLLTIHHLIVDGYSWRLLLEDAADWYGQALVGAPLELKAKTSSCQQWSQALHQYAASDKLTEQLAYWNAVASSPRGTLPMKRTCDLNRIADIEVVGFACTSSETNDLLRNVHMKTGIDTMPLLLAALGIALREWNGLEHFRLDIAGHGRQLAESECDVSRTVGWFTCTYPLEMNLVGLGDKEVAEDVRKRLALVPDHGIGYGLLRHTRESDEEGFELVNEEEPAIFFNYMGQFGHEADNEWFVLEEDESLLGQLLDGENKRFYPLEVIAKVVQGKLKVVIGYSREQICALRMSELASSYKRQLLRMLHDLLIGQHREAGKSALERTL